MAIPLPELLRPKTLKGFVGQEHLVGKDGIINKLLLGAQKTNFFPSLVCVLPFFHWDNVFCDIGNIGLI